MQKYFEILRKCPLFFHIEDENLIAILSCLGVKVKSYKKRETVMSEGDPARSFGIVLSGSVQIVRMDYFGNRSILSGASPSELFGESFACAGTNELPVSVIASENCEIMFVECFRVLCSCSNACSFHRQMIYNLMKDVATKNIMFHQKIEVTSKRSTREKLLTYLMIEAKKNDSRSFNIPYDRQELADYLEVDRSGLSAEISKMRDEGIIESQKNHFELLNV
ncbi:MAG: Crp/Fnr family transcriptional regulator [Clostridia bacterium]|nr:Crp/Fnr family transcriptional regulator [Clostridia bacterium]